MNISERGLDLIKGFETCQLDAYMPTPEDVPTIGWGHTGPEVVMGLQWTQEQADVALAIDVEKFERCVNKAIREPISQQEFDALCSFAFNVGCQNFQTSTLAKLLNSGDHDKAADEFARWNKQKGKVLAGLTRRREAERELFEAVA